jgi:hypothetical protein
MVPITGSCIKHQWALNCPKSLFKRQSRPMMTLSIIALGIIPSAMIHKRAKFNNSEKCSTEHTNLTYYFESKRKPELSFQL